MILSRRLHPDENLACHQADDHGHDHGKTGGDPSGISDETAHVLVILCANRCATGMENPVQTPMTKPLIIKLMAEVEPTEASASTLRKFSNNDRIDHAVKLLE